MLLHFLVMLQTNVKLLLLLSLLPLFITIFVVVVYEYLVLCFSAMQCFICLLAYNASSDRL